VCLVYPRRGFPTPGMIHPVLSVPHCFRSGARLDLDVQGLLQSLAPCLGGTVGELIRVLA
jgi:hypothetical protein